MTTIKDVQGFLTDNKKDGLVPVRVDIETSDSRTRITMHDHNKSKSNQLDMTLSIPREAVERSLYEEGLCLDGDNE